MVVDNRITETPELTGQFMVFPKSFGSEDAAQKPLSRMSREQLAAFLNAESGNARSAHFSAPPAESTPPDGRERSGYWRLETGSLRFAPLPDRHESRPSGTVSRRSQLGDGV